MSLITLKKLDEEDPTLNPNVYFIYLENYKNTGGDYITKMFRKRDNTLPITIKKSGGKQASSYWTYDDSLWVNEQINTEFSNIEEALYHNMIVILPLEIMHSEHYNEALFEKISKPIFTYFSLRYTSLISGFQPKSKKLSFTERNE